MDQWFAAIHHARRSLQSTNEHGRGIVVSRIARTRAASRETILDDSLLSRFLLREGTREGLTEPPSSLAFFRALRSSHAIGRIAAPVEKNVAGGLPKNVLPASGAKKTRHADQTLFWSCRTRHVVSPTFGLSRDDRIAVASPVPTRPWELNHDRLLSADECDGQGTSVRHVACGLPQHVAPRLTTIDRRLRWPIATEESTCPAPEMPSPLSRR